MAPDKEPDGIARRAGAAKVARAAAGRPARFQPRSSAVQSGWGIIVGRARVTTVGDPFMRRQIIAGALAAVVLLGLVGALIALIALVAALGGRRAGIAGRATAFAARNRVPLVDAAIITDNYYLGRVDYNITDKEKIFVRYSQDTGQNESPKDFRFGLQGLDPWQRVRRCRCSCGRSNSAGAGGRA